MTIDLNCDVGEGYDADDALLGLASSASVSTGAYTRVGVAGADLALERAVVLGVAVGMHPGYPDLEGFGRRRGFLAEPAALASELARQRDGFLERCARAGATCAYLKPHGGLYHDAAHDPTVARALVRLADELGVPLLCRALAGEARPAAGLAIEGFAERRYRPDGQLVARGRPGALIDDPDVAAAQAVRLAASCDSLCVHGDSPGALAVATRVRRALEGAGYAIAAFAPAP